MDNSVRILIAPLNWGLGHASRCIPIIRRLLRLGATVVLASDGRAAQLLQEEFPELSFHSLPPYGITYPTRNMIFNMLLQFPRLLRAVSRERKAIERLVEEEQIDVVISDHRYGCHTSAAHSIFMTHQLRIKTPLGRMDGLTERAHQYLLAPFDEIWVPDYPGEPNLSGSLSHRGHFNRQIYLGPLSRMQAMIPSTFEQEVIIILSGPEPQRTKLEAELREEAMRLDHLSFLFVQGKTETFLQQRWAPHVRCVSFLTSEALNRAIASSRYIISRSGYSTIMDLCAMRRTALLIPTPGQTEQEYLATHFVAQGVFATQKQGAIRLEEGLLALAHCQAFAYSEEEDLLGQTLERLLEQLQS